MRIFEKWYTPAETKIPIHIYANALLGRHKTQGKTISNIIGPNVRWGPSARAMFSYLLHELMRKGLIKSDSEILIPGYTCSSLAETILNHKLKIDLYDINYKTFAPVYESIESSINSKTRVLLIQYLFGIPFNLKEILALADKYNLILIEDNAQGLGCKYADEYVGKAGHYALFSFGRGKPLPALSGGLLLDNVSKNILCEAKTTKTNFTEKILPLAVLILSSPYLYKYVELLNIVSRESRTSKKIDNVQISSFYKNIILQMFDTLDVLNEHRREIARIYKNKLSKNLIPRESSSAYSIYNRFPLVMETKIKLTAQSRKYGLRKMYTSTIDRHAVLHQYINKRSPLPGCDILQDHLITLPTHLRIDSVVVNNIIKEVNSYN